jgi:hypothetical protein
MTKTSSEAEAAAGGHEGVPLAVTFGSLVDLPRWVAWNEELRDGELTKVPKNPVTGDNAKSNDPATWATLEDAEYMRDERGFTGVGIVLGEGLGGVDLDCCRNPETGEVAPWARQILDAFRTYAEVSPSRTGIKLFAFGAPDTLPANVVPVKDAPPIGGKTPQAEAYVSGRYFAVTGQLLAGSPDEIRDCSELGGGWDRMIASLRKHAKKNGSAPRVEGKIPAGTRNQTLASLAGTMRRRGMSEGAIRAALLEENARCEPPLPEREVAAIARSVSRYDPEEPTEAATALGPAKPKTGTGDAPKGEANSSEDGARTFFSLAELQAQPGLLDPPQNVVPRLAYRGRLVILAGPDKSGKSTLLAHAAAALTNGQPFFGEPTKPGRVVWLGLEEAVSDAVRRFVSLGANGERVQVLATPAHDLLIRLDALLNGWPADLVVVDSLQEYARVTCGTIPPDGDNAAWSGVVRPLVALARSRDVALDLLHHVRRVDGQYRGASEIAAAADAVLEIVLPVATEDQSVRRIRGRGRWNIERFTVALRDGAYELGGGGGELSIDARVLLFVENNPGASRTQIRKQVEGRAATIGAAINRLELEGAIENVGSERQAKYATPSGQESLGVG